MKRFFATSCTALLIFIAPADTPAGARAGDCSDGTTVAAVPNEHNHSFARGGDGELREPVLDEPVASLPTSAKGKGSGKFKETVLVYFTSSVQTAWSATSRRPRSTTRSAS